MTVALITLALLVVLAVVAFIVLYNGLVTTRNQMREGWSGIEVQLKRRHDLIPNLVACVQESATIEQAVLLGVTEARTKASAARDQHDARIAGEVEQELVHQVGKICALSEDYPELQSGENFRQLMTELVEIEDHLQYARRYYNGSVRDYNNKVESMPSNLVAQRFRFESAPFFEVPEVSERLAPSLKTLLN